MNASEARRAIMKAVREAYPSGKVWWTGDGESRSTLWLTEDDRERLLELHFDVPGLSIKGLVAEVMEALEVKP